MGGNAADGIKRCSLYCEASVHLSTERILCLLVYLCIEHTEGKKRCFGLFVFLLLLALQIQPEI